jgi:NAD(P)-dependent dehydrogenase (short-subunit alcohol dehydrogenase family)
MQKMPQQAADDFETFGGRTVVITGGAPGIGLATARMVVDRGGSVILMGRSPERLKAAREALGSAASTIQLDVTDEDAVRTAFADIDRVDHLVTAALRGRLVDLDTRHARQLFEVKYWGLHNSIKYAAPRMAPHGSVVLFSGWISRKPAAEMSTLAAIDGAIEALARTLALVLRVARASAVGTSRQLVDAAT